MKKLFAAALLGTLGFATQANAVVIDFDGFADNTVLAVGAFDAIGVRFNQRLQVNDGDIGDLPFSLPNSASNFDSFGGNVTGFFLGPVSSVDFISVFAGDAGGDTDTVTLRGFDALNNLVASSSFTGISAQSLSIAGAGIVRFEILQTGLIAFDNFRFEPTRVSEPAMLGMLGLGLAAFGLARRRKS
jgi:hypothetical protein